MQIEHTADPTREIAIWCGEILQHRGDAIGPGVYALIDAEHLVAGIQQAQREVGADLAARAGDQDVQRLLVLRYN